MLELILQVGHIIVYSPVMAIYLLKVEAISRLGQFGFCQVSFIAESYSRLTFICLCFANPKTPDAEPAWPGATTFA
jgi:hypothetical protein